MSCLFSLHVFGAEGRYEFKVTIVPESLHEIEINGNDKILLLDRARSNTSEEKFKLKAKAEFKPNNSGYEEMTNPLRRTYQWKTEGNMSIDDEDKQVALFSTTEETWGQEFEIEVEVSTIIVGGKKVRIKEKGRKKAIAPKIIIKSATFSETGGGNGFKILEKFRGNPVSTPEFIRDDRRGDDERSPAGFYAGKKVSYIPEFEVLPQSIETISAYCEGNILGTAKKEFSVQNGKVKEKVEGKENVPLECQKGPDFFDESVWKFEIYGVELGMEEKAMDISYYVLLHQGSSEDRPWKNLLKAAFDRWGIGGAATQQQLIDQLSSGISRSSSYNHDGWNPAEGKRSSLYVDQQKSPMPLAVSKMVDAFCVGNAKIICVEAAGLMEYAASVLGGDRVTSRGINWTETESVFNPSTNQMDERSWSNGHSYCLSGGLVHDPVPHGSGPTGMNEKDYIDEKIKKYDENRYPYKRSDFRNLGAKGFAFK